MSLAEASASSFAAYKGSTHGACRQISTGLFRFIVYRSAQPRTSYETGVGSFRRF